MPLDITQLDSNSIIFGGLTLIGLTLTTSFGILLRYIIKKHSETDKMYFNHTNDVINMNTQAFLEHAKATQKWSDSLDGLGIVIKEFHKK